MLVDGWMHTGDIAVMDADGYVQITGRIKDMVIRGGENIYPREIEEFLYTHPDVLDAQVIGVPDEKYGEELCAWVRMRDGAEPLTAESLREYADGPARALQDPALRAGRRGVPDDGHRQGAQGRDARGHGQPSWGSDLGRGARREGSHRALRSARRGVGCAARSPPGAPSDDRTLP